jgi:hypothetical protein
VITDPPGQRYQCGCPTASQRVADGLRASADVLDIAVGHLTDTTFTGDPAKYLEQFAETLRRSADTYSPRQEG